jgi:SAM-dependent methyltransferase
MGDPFTTPRPRASAIDAIEGFYLTHVLNYFHRLGLLAEIGEGVSVHVLADKYGFDSKRLEVLLEFLAERSKVIVRCGGRDRPSKYKLADGDMASDYSLGFQLDKFVGGYGPAIADLGLCLLPGKVGAALVDREIESAAYHRVGSPPNPVVLAIMSSLRYPALLDLGCGPGTTLAALAGRDAAFVGWGVDLTEAMCVKARSCLDNFGVSDRIEIIHADARFIDAAVTASIRQRTEVIHCKGLMNELFGGGGAEATAYLGQLRRAFPGRLLLNVDYYGKLGRLRHLPSRYRHTLLHDVVQTITGQGIPPADSAGWADVYSAAGAELEHAYEGDDSGIEWCVHVVRL